MVLPAISAAAAVVAFLILAYAAWRRYLWATEPVPAADDCPYGLTDVFGGRHVVNAPHQQGVRWLTEVFSRSVERFPHHPALQIPHTGDSLTFAELDARAERVAAALAAILTGPDQVVAVAMAQDSWHIVACHLGILKAGGTVMFLDSTLPDALITHMLNDAQPAVILTRGQDRFRDLPTLDVLTLSETTPRREPPPWLDDPARRLAAIFYTSGTTGLPKGVECPHAGYVNLALSYADYFDLIPGMDATSLTSSLGYDGSISEMYSAWVFGCTVVMLTKEQVRSGPDLVPVLRDAEVTVLFCPPVLLTTLTQTPEIDLPYPLCRYVVPAGEAFPAALVEPWTRGRRQIINTYGPTEASTDTSRQSLRPGEPITIGSPFPNVTYLILEVDGLRPLPHGEVGELCIGGVHLARGYRNLPDQTARKFITHPRFGRLYRSGDKCRIDIKTQRVHFLGRIDAQLKVRGHRVEAQAVEDILQTQFSEIEAAVLDYQSETLVAFIAAPSLSEGEPPAVAAAPADWTARVTAVLAERLPPPSIPSRVFLVDKFVMKPLSGKIDRGCLPNLSDLLARPARLPDGEFRGEASGAPNTASDNVDSRDPIPTVDTACEDVLAVCRATLELPLGPDDEFVESGAHSVGIARLAQRLKAAGWPISVRALYTDCNTARKIAASCRVAQDADVMPSPQATRKPRIIERDEAAAQVLSVAHFTTLQVLFAALLYSPGLLLFAGALNAVEFGTIFTTAGLAEFIAFGFGLYVLGLATPFAVLLWVMAIKLLIGGDLRKNNVTPGVYPKWSRMHLRLWRIGRLEQAALGSLSVMYRSAPLLAFALRQLGANVGTNLQCAHDADLGGPLDLISIGDDVAIQTGAYVHATRWSDEELHVGRIHLDSGCKIGMRAAVGDGVTVGPGAWTTPFTAVLTDVGANEMWEGAPGRFSGRCIPLRRTATACRSADSSWLRETVNVLMQAFVSFWIGVAPTAAILWLARDLVQIDADDYSAAYFTTTPILELVGQLTAYGFVTTWLTVVVTSVLGCLFVRCTAAPPGLYPSRGLRGALLLYRMSIVNRIQRQWTWTITGQYLRALAGMRFPRVGGSECDVMINLVPELATADSATFWSNGCFTNMLDYGAEHIALRRLDMPYNFFAGNNCVAEHGQLPSNFLVGVSTPCSDIRFRRQMRSRTGCPITVAGSPPIKFAGAKSEAETEADRPPGFVLFSVRLFLNDLLGIGLLPVTEGLLIAIGVIVLLRAGLDPTSSTFLVALLAEIGLVVLAGTVKIVLVGREWGADHAAPFWSWRHFSYFFAQDCFFTWCRGALGFCAGTVLANPILRWMGCRIGRRTLVAQPLQCFDWNAVDFGNDCVVDGVLQLHSFEDRTLRVKRAHIGDRSAIGFGATVMGGAMIEHDTTLRPLSLVLKEMTIAAGTYHGSPAEPVGDSTVSRSTADEPSAGVCCPAEVEVERR
ncbi:MAG: AMP-binding protein [Rhodoplanes sp.]|uniref:non-ribosomal peptide synthetase n=1 Tax=Rhodoplanes sp. TaxID=1968906 RepID=UPI00182B59FB|nr:AMP-binding protein [Rhodoplanes sp.]NVO17717.1 AMP-binding protein [Rhodoplanes sp.]